jgi:hypothetical protein
MGDNAMIIALAGRRIDAAEAHEPRFPLHMKNTVRKRLHDLFAEQSATTLVCSGACGADLLALDVARELGMHRCMVLPFGQQQFREMSVTDREPADEWGALFDRIVDELTATDDLLTLEGAEAGQQAYEAVNRTILDEASRLAQNFHGSEGSSRDVLVVAVWEGESRGAEDLTAALLEEAQTRGFQTTEILSR